MLKSSQSEHRTRATGYDKRKAGYDLFWKWRYPDISSEVRVGDKKPKNSES